MLCFRMGRALAGVLTLCVLAGCGTLPQPFLGNPGANAMRLAAPPPSRLAVPAPQNSLLSDEGASAWAEATAAALTEQEIPAVAGHRSRGDWALVLSADLQGGQVVPTYAVENPAGQKQGVSQGAPIPAGAWAAADANTLKAAAAQAAPGINALLTRIEAARRQSDPNSLINRPARVWLVGVSGAPGDGGRTIPMQMRLKLADAGLVVQDTAKDADFKVEGQMQTAPGANGTLRIELQWIVTDNRGERGRILQINEVPPRAVEPYWGDAASVVASEAAGGVKDVIVNSGARGK